MKEISSYYIHLKEQPLSMKEIMNIYRFVEQSTYDVYLYQDDLIADTSILPKLLSFFLYYQRNEPILMIIDGENVEYAYQRIMKYFETPIDECYVRNTHVAKEDVAIQV